MRIDLLSWLRRRNASRTISSSGLIGKSNSKTNDSNSDLNSNISYLLLKNITYGYKPHNPIIEKINILIPKGRFVGLIGPSGSGKSTLMKIIAGIYKPWSGSVDYFYTSHSNNGGNTFTRKIRSEVRNQEKNYNPNILYHSYHPIPKNEINPFIIGYVPQVETVDWNFPVTVKEVVSMGVWDRSGNAPFLSKNIISEINQVLDSLGVNSHEFGKRQISELSGGEQQRVFLARALVRKPSILLLDEPTTGVDYKTKEKILSILMSLSLAGITIIMTTHDISGIVRKLHWVVCMNRRIIAEGCPAEVLTETNLMKTYGLAKSDDVVTDDEGVGS
jgi:ABC-type Mn2+/Zn2+ transport system ATPase subunit